MPFGICKMCEREFWFTDNDPVKWVSNLDLETGEMTEGVCDVCSDCWTRGWFKEPWSIGTGDPDWEPRPEHG